MKQVLHLFGASGSGTTTLGKKLAEELGFTFMDTDDYFWMPTDPKFTVKRPTDERIALMKRDIQNAEHVVLSGSLAGWGDVLIPFFTLAVRIEMAPDLRIKRLVQREKERFGLRIEPGGDMHAQHLAFVEWARAYDTGGMNQRSKVRHDAWQKQLPCPVLCVNGADSIEENVERIKRILNK